MKGKFVKKTVPATTNNITTAIINHLLSEGHSASRVNVQGQWDEGLGRWRKSGSRKGVTDIIATIETKWKPFVASSHGLGISFVVDVKNGKDKLRVDQIEFMEEIKNAGGIAISIHTYEEYLDFYNNTLKPFYLK